MPEANDRQAVLEGCVSDLGFEGSDRERCLFLIRNGDSDGSLKRARNSFSFV